MAVLKMALWCFHLPIALTEGIALTFYGDRRIPWIWAGVVVLSAVSYGVTYYDIRRRFLPQKRNRAIRRRKPLDDECAERSAD